MDRLTATDCILLFYHLVTRTQFQTATLASCKSLDSVQFGQLFLCALLLQIAVFRARGLKQRLPFIVLRIILEFFNHVAHLIALLRLHY